MLDETTDKANKEQVVFIIWWVDDNLVAHEEFIGLYQTASITSEALVCLIKDVLMRMNLKLKHCRGQCYDGASAMSGAKKGVAKRLLEEEPCAVFTHCYGHALNLVVSDCVKQCKVMEVSIRCSHQSLQTHQKISKKRCNVWEDEGWTCSWDTRVWVLCPTQWTVLVLSLKSIIDNYEVLLKVWKEVQSDSLDGEMRARIVGVETQSLQQESLQSLQQERLSAAQGQRLAKLNLSVLEKMRADDQFSAFYQRVVQEQVRFSVTDPVLPGKCRVPQKFEVGSSTAHFHSTPEACYRCLRPYCGLYLVSTWCCA